MGVDPYPLLPSTVDRDFLRPGKVFNDCAVIGTTGSVLHFSFGKEIDEKDGVFRIDMAGSRVSRGLMGLRTCANGFFVTGECMFSTCTLLMDFSTRPCPCKVSVQFHLPAIRLISSHCISCHLHSAGL